MAGKKGMKKKINDENSPRCLEYYKKKNPTWSEEDCINALNYYRKSCNSGCIEYYERKYPKLTHDEHLKMLNDKKKKNSESSRLHLEYYIKNYPELTLEQQKKLLHNFMIERNYQCKEYYELQGYDEKTAIELAKTHSKIAGKKISEKVSGELNGMYHLKTSQEKRNSISPRNIEFYIRKYPELSIEECENLRQDFYKKNNERVRKTVKDTNIEYYLNQGLSKEEAYLKLKERQTTFTLEKCIKKYGEEIGTIKYAERQRKWLNKLYENFQSNGDGRSKQSQFAKTCIKEICKYFKIQIPKKEYYIYDKANNRAYAYDFCYNHKIIEFNGDFWHCNPNIYNETFYHKVKQQTAKEIWEYDKIKTNTAEKYNYTVLTIWESEYAKSKEETIKKCIDFIKS